METINPTIEDFKEIIAFYPKLNRRDFDPIIEWKGGNKIDDNVNFMRWPIYDPVVTNFLDVASKECWHNYNYKHYEMKKMIESEIVVQCADLAQIKQMLSYCASGDKFISEGHMGTMIKEGHISRLLQRLDKLKDYEDSV
ncbi:MAG: DUF6508 domain-containing protein [Cocleimonas sp.]